jgi:hypothetical protein
LSLADISTGLDHLVERRPDLPLNKAGLHTLSSPSGNCRAYLAGWATDRFFGSRRGPVICVLMAAAVLSLTYDAIVVSSPIGTMIVWSSLGFASMGPRSFLAPPSPTWPIARIRRGCRIRQLHGLYEGGDWRCCHRILPLRVWWLEDRFHILAGWAACWLFGHGNSLNTTATDRLAASNRSQDQRIIAIVVASVAISSADQPMSPANCHLCCGWLSAGGLVHSFAALPALVVAAIGLLMVFSSYVRMSDGVTWQQATGMVAYGMTAITSLMIPVEKQDER